MPLPHIRHDALFRLTVSDPGRAGEMLQYCLPPEVVARMDPDRPPVLIDGTAINAEGVRTHADAIFRVHLKGDDDLLVLVIFEHKANLDYRTPLQVLQYMLRQWMIEMDTGTAANGRLSLILPIIFYHGKAEWSVPLSIQDMIHAPNGLEHLTRSFGHYQLENLGHMDADDLSFNIELRAALLALARAFRDHISDDEADILVAGIAETELGRYIQTYIIEQISLPPERMEAALRRIGTAPDRLEDIMGTAAQIWMQQGREEGLAVG